jgi:hypothetical protein
MRFFKRKSVENSQVEELSVSQQVSYSKYGTNFETHRLLLMERGEAETKP